MATGKLSERIRDCELELLHGDFRDQPAVLEKWLAPGFEELSPRGVNDRHAVMDWLLHKDSSTRWELEDFKVEVLAENLVLARYRARRVGATSTGAWHSSIWAWSALLEQWQMVFHHSTGGTDNADGA